MISRKKSLGLLIIGIFASLMFAATSESQAGPLPVAWLPQPGVVQLSPCIPHEGIHFGNRAQLPRGPIYVVYGTRLMAIEYLFTKEELAAGKSALDLKFVYAGRELPIQHADFDFLPGGIPGMEVPLYAVHFFLVTHADHHKIICQ